MVCRAIKELGNNKSAGTDQIPNEALKAAPASWAPLVMKLIQLANNTGELPSSLLEARITPIFKGKGPEDDAGVDDPTRYRPISVGTALYSVLAKLAYSQIREPVERHLNPCQSGFTAHRSTTDNLRLLTAIRGTAGTKWVAMLDLVKAYDSVNRAKLLRKLHEAQMAVGDGAPQWAFSLIQAAYASTNKAVIRVKEGLSDPVTVEGGVRQGDPHSPLLFNLYIDDLMNELDPAQVEAQGGLPVGDTGIRIYDLAYADDIVIFASTASELQAQLDKAAAWAARNGMKFAPSKSCILTNSDEEAQLTIGGDAIPRAKETLYLGWMHREHRLEAEVLRWRAHTEEAEDPNWGFHPRPHGRPTGYPGKRVS